MKKFSNNFSLLIESMKSSRINEEDKKELKGNISSSGRKEKREERKQERLEDRFIKGNEFRMNAFVNSLEILRDQIIGLRISIFNTLKNKGMGSKYGNPTLKKADSLFNNIENLLNNARNKKSETGKFLDISGGESEISNTYKNQYSEFKEELDSISKEWDDDINRHLKESPIDEKNKDLEKSLTIAKELFQKATREIISNSPFVIPGESIKKPESSDLNQEFSTIKGKKEAYKGKEADVIIEVKKLIYNKFKKYGKLTSSNDWKLVYKDPNNPSPTLRENTVAVIKAIKAGLSKDYPELASDKTGDITPAFYNILKSLKEGLMTGGLKSFNDFIKMNEEFDEDAAVSSLKSSEESKKTYSSRGDNKEELEPTPFDSKEEGNKFREWVNKNHKEWAKDNSLDTSGPENNSYIRKAYKEFGEEYKKESNLPKEDKSIDKNKKKDLSEELEPIASWLGVSIKTNKEKGFKYIKGKIDIDIENDLDSNGIYIYYGSTGRFTLGRSEKGKEVKGKWSKSGKKYVIGDKTYLGDSIKSALLKMIKKEGGTTSRNAQNVKPG